MMLIRTYRVRGHLAADLDPLGLTERTCRPTSPPNFTASPTPTSTGRSGSAARWVSNGRRSARSSRSCRPTIAAMSASNICTSTTWRSGASSRSGWKARTPRSTSRPRASARSSTKVIEAEQWEKFLARKYVGTKSFGLDGGESAVPALEAVIKYGGQYGVTEIDVGMAHRGRLNVLANVMGKPYRAIFNEFAGGATNPGGCRRVGRREISPRHLVGPRVRRQQGSSVAASQPVASRSGRSGRARQGAGGA